MSVSAYALPRIAVLVDTSSGWGRRIVRGISQYAHEQGGWDIWLEERGQRESLRLPKAWAGDGVIARVTSQAMAEHLAMTGAPTVNVSGIELGGAAFCRVTTNQRSAAVMAADYFMERGFRSFGYCGPRPRSFVEPHRAAFLERVTTAGCLVSDYAPTRSRESTADPLARLSAWLGALTRPCAVLTWSAPRGVQVVAAARRAGLDVPSEIAVLAGDDDDLLCEVAHPSVSGVVRPAEQIGHRAAHMLDALMARSQPTDREVFFEPITINTRASTDTFALDDDDVVRALRFMHRHAHRPVTVEDILDSVPISRRALERRFLRAIGRSPGQEIRRIRVGKAAGLLVETDLPVSTVAHRCGFGSAQYMIQVFRADRGITPLRYRRMFRPR